MAIELDKALVAQASALIEQAKKIVIFTHVAPDGDAMGSALALWHYCNGERLAVSGERSATVIVPNAFPEFFNWMPGADKILVYETQGAECDKAIAEADLFLCTDFNEPKRINPAGDKMLANPAPKIMIDHHLNPTDFADVTFSFTEACSASEIVYRLIKSTDRFQVDLRLQNTDLATCLYTGIMTDTGNFSYNSDSPELFEIVAQLLRTGIDKNAIYNAVFNQYSTDRVRLTGYALYRKMRIYPEYHLALITLSADELDQYHYKTGDCEGLVNMPLQIADVYYSVFMREERPKPGTKRSRIRISFRSQGDRPVNDWAHVIFHGGGHMNASGGEMLGSLAKAVELFENSYPMFVKKD